MNYYNDEELTDLNNEKTAFNLNNYLEIQPTMDILQLRNPEVYQGSRCYRCNYTHESWIHIWICEYNDTTVNQICNEAFES